MSQLGEFLANIQNQQDARTAALEARLAELEGKKECECAETITALEARLATLESKEECGCAETISTLEARLATLESKEECGCGSYDELLASYEQRISALEGNTGGGTEGEGGSTEPIPASQALEEYNHLIGFTTNTSLEMNEAIFISAENHKYAEGGYCTSIGQPYQGMTVASLLNVNEGDIVKVYTPDLQEIEIIADTTQPYRMVMSGLFSIAFGNKETKEVYCYDIDSENRSISLCTDEAFIAQWGNSDALGL